MNKCKIFLRLCVTSRKVSGWIPDGVVGIFYYFIRGRRTMSMGSIQPLTEMSKQGKTWV
jgi:hypothetical protein